jgi:hypothetical protein
LELSAAKSDALYGHSQGISQGDPQRRTAEGCRRHLQGRIAFIESINLEKGKRLRAIFDQISWG